MRPLLALLFLLGGTVVTGCGGSSDLPDLTTVEGKVTLDGKPMNGVLVTYMSDTVSRNPSGYTDAEGHYVLSYSGTNTGAPPGNYQVAITAGEGAAPVYPPGIDPDKLSESQRAKYLPEVISLPAKYTNGTSLTAEVKPGGNTIDFPLTAK